MNLRRPFIACLSLLLAACGGSPTPSGGGRNPPTLEAPAQFAQDVTEPISLASVSRLKYLGRLTQPETPGTLFSVSLSPDGTRLAGINDSLLLSWNLTDGALLIQTSRQGVMQVYYSPDKTEIYGVTEEGAVLVFNADSGAVVDSFRGVERFAQVATFDPFNGWLALGGQDGSVKVWDPFERRALATIQAHSAPVTALAFSADGEEIISAAGDRLLRRFRWSDRTLTAEREIGRASSLLRLAASPSGDWIVVSTDFNATLWSVSDPARVVALETGQGGANQLLTFSPDGRFLVAGNRVGGLTLWDIASARLAARLPQTISSRTAAAFAPSGDLLITSALDVGVSLWNLQQVTAQTINQAALSVGTTRIHDVAWTPDERLLLLFDAGGAVYLWGVG
ncbi:MAG: hypothetical protein JNL42_23780 [Anaerolineae bacterium]|nr:hypothetical protein [Anaerolineae bacterium]